MKKTQKYWQIQIEVEKKAVKYSELSEFQTNISIIFAIFCYEKGMFL
jgi:hypothetical protein